MMLSIHFEEPNFGADKSKVVISATAFVGENPSGFELKMYDNNTVGKLMHLEVDANPLGTAIYNFFKNKIFKVKPIRNLEVSMLTMFADWRINPEELKDVFNRANSLMGQKWEEALRAEKKK
jgi:hypothetical protein